MSKVLEENNENKSFLKINSCTISDFCHKDEERDYIHFNACELCKRATLDPVNVASASRLLEINVLLRNVCPEKELTVGCVIMDRAGTVLAFKSQTFTVSGTGHCSNTEEDSLVYDKDKSKSHCPSSPCVNTNRTFSFILPDRDLCSALDVKVKIIANYTHPC